MKTNVAEALLKKYGKANPPQLNAGDTVRIHQKIKEGDKERVQVFEGLVIAIKHGKGLDGSFTVRKIAMGGIGVERVFPLHSPNVVKVERTKTAKVSRAKLYYMRYRLGKSARFKEEGRNPGSWQESEAVEELPEIIEEPTEEVEENVEVPQAEEVAETEEVVDTEEAVEPSAEEQPQTETAEEAVENPKSENTEK